MKPYNTTQLYIDRAEDRGIVHRDYLAHCLRWTHIVKYAKMGQKILDVGCGVNIPLAWMMYTNKFKPFMYMGLDYRDKFEVDVRGFNFPVTLVGNFDVTNEAHWQNEVLKSNDFDIVTCLEVIEHMPKESGIKLLENLATEVSGSVIFLSTPCFNGSKAANHIYEWRYDELKAELESMFTIEAHFGTFASQSEILLALNSHERDLFERLRRYYDSNVLSVIFAPLYPSLSRNVMWQLRVK